MSILKTLNRDAFKISAFFLCVFAFSFGVLYALSYVPNELQDPDITSTPKSNRSDSTSTNPTPAPQKQVESPVRISIEKIGVNSIVQNPTTTNVYALDQFLLKGVVRYPGSGLLGQGNMFLFGHSTGLKVVNNQAFKAFNNLKNLVAGDIISVYSDTSVYYYKVNTVKLVNTNNALVDFTVKKNMLTLSTCNTFGQKEDRYVVEADFVGVSPL